MTVMTKEPRALAGSSLRTVLSKAAAAPLSGAFWGAFMTLLVQSSSATAMTTIGPVSAGLLTFPQGLGLVFSTNVGTRDGLARGARWGSRLALLLRAADDLRRGVGQTAGQRTHCGRKRDVTAAGRYAAIACEPAPLHFQGSSSSIFVFG
jgi:Na+/Pi-cotransporter